VTRAQLVFRDAFAAIDCSRVKRQPRCCRIRMS
jgi:hypothetical protein